MRSVGSFWGVAPDPTKEPFEKGSLESPKLVKGTALNLQGSPFSLSIKVNSVSVVGQSPTYFFDTLKEDSRQSLLFNFAA